MPLVCIAWILGSFEPNASQTTRTCGNPIGGRAGAGGSESAGGSGSHGGSSSSYPPPAT